jgi:uncharacterized protein YdiU (UPF0061 family)
MNSTPNKRLGELQFDNRFLRDLPADPSEENLPRQVAAACYSRVLPVEGASPQLLAVSAEVLGELGIELPDSDHEHFARVFAGNERLEGMDPYAMCYGGHQFGNWAGQLGDGRAINLGEVVSPAGQHWTLQLKGAGPTPYSRMGDGFAVLRSSVREFLCSEAMHHLGVPTTRALSLVLTGDEIMRDMFYDGHPQLEPGAVVCRVAPTFVRFGSFQIFASRGDITNLRRLADYTIRNDFPELVPVGEPLAAEHYVAWFEEICRRTAKLMAHWMRVGFVHGVMNTDNMSITGLTIDYGPYGWLEDYDPNWTPNTTDSGARRYRYGNQAQIALWNLLQLANAIHPLVADAPPLESALANYSNWYRDSWQTMFAAKLGWADFRAESDAPLTEQLFSILPEADMDMTLFFRLLANLHLTTPSQGERSSDDYMSVIGDAFYSRDQLADHVQSRLVDWLAAYESRCQQQDGTPADWGQRMNAANPKFVLRNYLAQMAIDKAAEGDSSLIAELLDVLRHPYDEQPGKESFAEKRPEWARHRPGCSMLSCSS